MRDDLDSVPGDGDIEFIAVYRSGKDIVVSTNKEDDAGSAELMQAGLSIVE